ncbi:DMT family transporter [Serratia ficaria]|uniref:Putative DMT superfamily transporter inner membrane protein n=1 Tax=Serratia ficaria TaxID=61651 RepID=A0A240BTF2_SERFI|nr:DMT family transporter [Serratia ficaria]REF45361.1 threonine/homoserine efflux transporter RhtA [Serratia ficaria]CAI0690518.1 putative DMT superfamily transporter inner membrane protein [Serratia ficaria]CAI0844704.1 putative DMT superfamily transporter inner membrane protein [Serratia ficaria]CAI0886787.1 putative DMT superfamily transporter inner membrane protein [Serratia ficaria]CAI0894211.1 putative DMT superfamily transporter inner membrane protein [Serratia ficaria]
MSAVKKSFISAVIPQIRLQEAVLIFITMIWGGTFLAVQHAMQVSGPFFFVGLRFATATLVLTLFSLRALRGLTWYELKAGMLIGVSIMFGYGLQTVGLQTISSSQSAFITALYVPIVPLLQWLVLGRFPGIMSWIGILLAFTGLMLLAAPSSADMTLSIGEILTLVGTLGMAAEIVLIGAYAGKVNIRRVTIVQLATASLASFLMMAPTGESTPPYSDYLLYSAIGLGLASAMIQLTMNWAQRSMSPTRATVIYAGEPVWAGVVGRIAGERLPGVALLGGAMIVIGVLVSELRLRRKGKPAAVAE